MSGKWLEQHPVQPASFDPLYVQTHSRCKHLTVHHKREHQIDPVDQDVCISKARRGKKGTITPAIKQKSICLSQKPTGVNRN